jgi:hypothetical protein
MRFRLCSRGEGLVCFAAYTRSGPIAVLRNGTRQSSFPLPEAPGYPGALIWGKVAHEALLQVCRTSDVLFSAAILGV